MRKLLLGIDIGTSGLKTAVFSPEEGLVAAISESYSVDYPHAGWAEQDPMMWWKAVCVSLQRLWAETDIKPEEIAVMACVNPAKVAGCKDRGELKPGMRADVIVLDKTFTVQAVFSAGKRVK